MLAIVCSVVHAKAKLAVFNPVYQPVQPQEYNGYYVSYFFIKLNVFIFKIWNYLRNTDHFFNKLMFIYLSVSLKMHLMEVFT